MFAIADGQAFDQILENLLSNAIRYANPAHEEQWVEVTARRVDGAVRIAVKDNGIGVPEALKDRIFEMFFRGSKASAEGSGLGLYLVKQHTEQMGASIELDSSPEGSTFTIIIPGS